MASALVERYDDRIAGVLSCYDRVVVTGTLSLSVILCARHNQRQGAYYAEQSEESRS
jgi:hypothetical protein